MVIELIALIGIMFSLVGIGISYLLTMHGLWQLDIVCINPVWGTQTWIKWFLETGYENYSDYPFQCGLWKTTMGRAYDVYLSYPVVGWFLLLVSMCVLMISIMLLIRGYYLKTRKL